MELKIGKRYIADNDVGQILQYTGESDDKNFYTFEWTNPLNIRVVIRKNKTQNIVYTPFDNETGYETDKEFLDDPYSGGKYKKSRKCKRSRKYKKSRKCKRSRKHKKSRKY
jgi:hypothetical protein